MFTGIIEAVAELAELSPRGDVVRLAVAAPALARAVGRGDSVAVNGACLSVAEPHVGQLLFDAVPETLQRTALGALRPGDRVNLERAVRADARLDGHIVQGHVDEAGRVAELRRSGDDVRLFVESSAGFAELLAPKGGVAVDGVSLTVVGVRDDGFDVALIPHTLGGTTLGALRSGDRVNLEADIIGKYVKRQLDRIAGAARALLCCICLALPATAVAAADAAPALEPPSPGLPARAVAERVEELFRGENSYFQATMTIRSPLLPAPRIVGFRAWDDRSSGRSFVRITAPPKDRGVAFLNVPPNLWNYIPRVERTLRIPPSMMLQSWMGSDFTNDDLVRESSQLDDYEHHWLGIAPAGAGLPRAYVIEYRPHEAAPVVWGRIAAWIDAERFAPLRQEFYDEAGALLRVMRFSDFRRTRGRLYPHAWSLIPENRPGHETAIQIEEIRFDEPIPDSIFTRRNLREGG